MELTYDPKYNIAYIRFRKKLKNVKTISVSEELNVDMAPDGKIYGIELLNANAQLQINKNGGVVIKNETTGRKIKLAV